MSPCKGLWKYVKNSVPDNVFILFYLQVLSLERAKIWAACKVMECDRLVANFGLQPLDTLGSGSAGPHY